MKVNVIYFVQTVEKTRRRNSERNVRPTVKHVAGSVMCGDAWQHQEWEIFILSKAL
jgi:hypothetical protein